MAGRGIKIGILIVYLTYFPYKSLGLSVNFHNNSNPPPAVINKATNMHIFTNISMSTTINILYRDTLCIINILHADVCYISI